MDNPPPGFSGAGKPSSYVTKLKGSVMVNSSKPTITSGATGKPLMVSASVSPSSTEQIVFQDFREKGRIKPPSPSPTDTGTRGGRRNLRQGVDEQKARIAKGPDGSKGFIYGRGKKLLPPSEVNHGFTQVDQVIGKSGNPEVAEEPAFLNSETDGEWLEGILEVGGGQRGGQEEPQAAWSTAPVASEAFNLMANVLTADKSEGRRMRQEQKPWPAGYQEQVQELDRDTLVQHMMGMRSVFSHQVKELEETVDDLQAKLQQLNFEKERGIMMFTSLQDEAFQQKVTIAELQSRLLEIEDEQNVRKKSLRDVAGEREKAIQTCEDLERQNVSLSKELEEAKREALGLSELAARAESLEKENAELKELLQRDDMEKLEQESIQKEAESKGEIPAEIAEKMSALELNLQHTQGLANILMQEVSQHRSGAALAAETIRELQLQLEKYQKGFRDVPNGWERDARGAEAQRGGKAGFWDSFSEKQGNLTPHLQRDQAGRQAFFDQRFPDNRQLQGQDLPSFFSGDLPGQQQGPLLQDRHFFHGQPPPPFGGIQQNPNFQQSLSMGPSSMVPPGGQRLAGHPQHQQLFPQHLGGVPGGNMGGNQGRFGGAPEHFPSQMGQGFENAQPRQQGEQPLGFIPSSVLLKGEPMRREQQNTQQSNLMSDLDFVDPAIVSMGPARAFGGEEQSQAGQQREFGSFFGRTN